jgi:hypothetical protein
MNSSCQSYQKINIFTIYSNSYDIFTIFSIADTGSYQPILEDRPKPAIHTTKIPLINWQKPTFIIGIIYISIEFAYIFKTKFECFSICSKKLIQKIRRISLLFGVIIACRKVCLCIIIQPSDYPIGRIMCIIIGAHR